MSKRAIITGVLGQDSSWLAEYLLTLNYDVYGIYKRVSSGNCFDSVAIAKKNPRFHLVEGDICDAGFINKIISELKPDEYYALAAQSHVGYSFIAPLETCEIDATAVLIQLEAIRTHSPTTKFYNAATSELFGGLNCPADGFSETSPFYPRSPYACAKQFAFSITKNYREAYQLFACSGILFNHSSSRRGLDFATRKITMGIASIIAGKANKLKMGNLTPYRDEGSAVDFIRAMHLILQQKSPDDFVVATGTGATIKEMLEYVCELANLKFEDVYEEDAQFMRPSEVQILLGNPKKIKSMGWEPQHTWKTLLKEMYEHDLNLLGGPR